MQTPYDSEEHQQFIYWKQQTDSQNLNISNCIASWTDICGFGHLLQENKWNLNSLQGSGAIKLLAEAHWIAGRPMLLNIDPLPNDKILVLNDGIARTIDLTHKDKLHGYSFLMFLRDLICSHYLLLSVTHQYGVGVRTILAGGERVQYSPIATTGESVLYYDENNISNFGKKLLNTTFVYNPAEFQMNTAFAKSFTIDGMGSRSGIKINGFYIEKSFLEKILDIADIKIEISTSSIKFFFEDKCVFDLRIIETLDLDIKGVYTTVYQIDKYSIYKEFDGDDVEFELFRL